MRHNREEAIHRDMDHRRIFRYGYGSPDAEEVMVNQVTFSLFPNSRFINKEAQMNRSHIVNLGLLLLLLTACTSPADGSFAHPYKVGDTVLLPPIPEELTAKWEDTGWENPYKNDVEFTLLEVKRGEAANEQAALTMPAYDYQWHQPGTGQEYLAIRGNIKFEEPGERFQVMMPWGCLMLRESEDGELIFSEAYPLQQQEGDGPMEETFWLFFLIDQGSLPKLFFRPLFGATGGPSESELPGNYFQLFP
jgi:hypothetical protein